MSAFITTVAEIIDGHGKRLHAHDDLIAALGRQVRTLADKFRTGQGAMQLPALASVEDFAVVRITSEKTIGPILGWRFQRMEFNDHFGTWQDDLDPDTDDSKAIVGDICGGLFVGCRCIVRYCGQYSQPGNADYLSRIYLATQGEHAGFAGKLTSVRDFFHTYAWTQVNQPFNLPVHTDASLGRVLDICSIGYDAGISQRGGFSANTFVRIFRDPVANRVVFFGGADPVWSLCP